MLNQRSSFVFSIISIVVVIVGCSGNGGTAESSIAGVTTTSAAVADTSAEPSDGGATTTVTESPSGDGTAAGVCELVTAEELAEIFSVPSVTTSVITGPPDNCIVESDGGDPLTAWSLTTAQASAVFDAFAADPETVDVPGIGDKAAFVQNTGLLVLKGDNLVVISISGGANLSDEEGMEAAKQIGALAADRL